jgi:hypothetical protein
LSIFRSVNEHPNSFDQVNGEHFFESFVEISFPWIVLFNKTPSAIPGRPTTPINMRFFESAFANIF